MYKMKFKCRMCGGIVEVPIKYNEARDLCKELSGEFDAFMAPRPMNRIHKCTNGDRGIMDLQGLSFFPD
jgi:hypothetical protein